MQVETDCSWQRNDEPNNAGMAFIIGIAVGVFIALSGFGVVLEMYGCIR